MIRRTTLAILMAALGIATFAGPVLGSNASCAAQFISAVAPVIRPFGTQVVVPEIREPTLGGPNVGQEVKFLFATADRSACPVTP
jgi:hypothetical protein